jgi:putative transposase
VGEKKLPSSVEDKRAMIESNHPAISIRRQCALIGLHRSTFYSEAVGESVLNLYLMRLIDEQYLRTPFNGYSKMTVALQRQVYAVNRKRVARLMQRMGLQALVPYRKLGQAAPDHPIYPYLLRGIRISMDGRGRALDNIFVERLWRSVKYGYLSQRL